MGWRALIGCCLALGCAQREVMDPSVADESDASDGSDESDADSATSSTMTGGTIGPPISVFCNDAADPTPWPDDVRRPDVELVEPRVNYTTILEPDEDFEVIAIVHDESCIATVQLIVNQEITDEEVLGSLDPIQWLVASAPVGSYAVSVLAEDGAGNREASGIAWIEVVQ